MTAAAVACDCGRTWTCTPEGACWCMALPPALPMPEDPAARCLCPCALERRIAEARRGEDAGRRGP